MSQRTARVVARTAFAVTIAMLAAGYVFTRLAPDAAGNGSWSINGAAVSLLFSLALLAFPAVGVLLAERRPGNAIGWLLLGIGLAWGIANSTSYADYALLRHPGSLPAAAWVAALGSSFWVPPIGLSGTFLILLFPDGRLLSPGWRWVAWLSAFGIVAGTLSLVLTPGLMGDAGYPRTRNPLGIAALAGVIGVSHALILLLPLTMALSAASLVVRYRRSRGDARQQMKWLAAAAAAIAGTYAVVEPLSVVLAPSRGRIPAVLVVLQDIALCSFGLIPVAIGFAVLRYRLYEIDRVISRTLSYAVVTGLLGGVFLALVALTTDVLPFSSPVGVAASTLAAAMLFNPLRRRVQHLVDRRFNRARYDADAAITAFADRLREAVDPDATRAELLAAVDRSVAPAHASLWMRPLSRSGR